MHLKSIMEDREKLLKKKKRFNKFYLAWRIYLY